MPKIKKEKIDTREDYRNFWEMLDLLQGLRTSGLTKTDIMASVRPSKNKPFGVSDKTAGRIIDSITNKYGSIQFYFDPSDKKYHLDSYIPSTIELEELRALDTVIKKSARNETLHTPLVSLNRKLTSRFDDILGKGDPKHCASMIADADLKRSSNYAFLGPRPIINVDTRTKEIIENAIFHEEIISFKYGKNKHEAMCPLGLMYGPNNLYLVASNANGYKFNPILFILEKIKEPKNTGKIFIRNENFDIDKFANENFGIYRDNKSYNIEWLADASVADEVKRYLFHPTQEFIDNADGSVTIKMHTGGLYAIAIYIFQWGGKIRPIAPAELIKEYRNLLETCLKTVK